MKVLLAHPDMDVDAIAESRHTPLMYAVGHRTPGPTLQVLFSSGDLDVNPAEL